MPEAPRPTLPPAVRTLIRDLAHHLDESITSEYGCDGNEALACIREAERLLGEPILPTHCGACNVPIEECHGH